MSARVALIALAALTALALARPAFSFGIGHLGASFGSLGAQGQGAPSAPQPTGSILRIDSVSHILRLDGTSKICRVGGC